MTKEQRAHQDWLDRMKEDAEDKMAHYDSLPPAERRRLRKDHTE